MEKNTKTPPLRKPDWLKIRPPGGENYLKIKGLLKGLGLHTVCEEARCPNVAECWGGGTATVMLLGDVCTRGCRFCHVKTGNPRGIVDTEEPAKVAHSISALGLKYVVLTSVDRDDLPDGGADHFAKTVEGIKAKSPDTLVEILIPDFKGDLKALERVLQSGADVIAHNLETVRRLTPKVRDKRATYDQSLFVLRKIKSLKPSIYTKSSLMLGLGETKEEVMDAMEDLLDVGVSVLTLGQYLQPSPKHLPVLEYISPENFEFFAREGEHLGFLYVASGPLVRSSYKAGEMFLEGLLHQKKSYQVGL